MEQTVITVTPNLWPVEGMCTDDVVLVIDRVWDWWWPGRCLSLISPWTETLRYFIISITRAGQYDGMILVSWSFKNFYHHKRFWGIMCYNIYRPRLEAADLMLIFCIECLENVVCFAQKKFYYLSFYTYVHFIHTNYTVVMILKYFTKWKVS